MEYRGSIQRAIRNNEKKIFNNSSDRYADKAKHGYRVNEHDLKLMHYRFIEQNHDAVVESGLEQIALKKKRMALYKQQISCPQIIKKGLICGNWKKDSFPMCRLCNWLSKNPTVKDKRIT